MSAPLLRTKLFMPSNPTGIARPTLMARLGDSLKRHLTLVCAPAGYGKTTLVSHWLKGRPIPTAWLSLDEADNDAERFWRYSITALQALSSDSEDALAALKPPLSSRETLTQLINVLTDLAQESVLVWDDYHEMVSEEIHDSVMFFLEHLPPHLHIIMTSRHEPPLPLSRMRVRGQLLELSANDLRFSHSEAASFLNEVMGLALSEKEVAALEARTEGWVASLQLAALTLQNSSDPKAAIATFAGTAHHVFDYLLSEVLNQQDKEMQAFLLQTSLLERFNAELCGAVTGVENANELLERIQKARLFLLPLDETRTWFRYHHLFAETLQQRLKQLRPERIPDLHASAAEWLEANGFTDEAVRHVIAGGDMERAVTLVEKHDRRFMWLRDELTTLRRWLQALPEEVIRARPRLCLDTAWLQIGQRGSERWLEDAERLLKEKDDAAMRGELAILWAEVAINKGDVEAALEQLDRSLELLPKEDVILRGMATQSRGYVLRVRGNVREAEATLRKAVHLTQQCGNKISELFALTDLGEVLKAQARLSEAKQVFEQAVARAREGHKEATDSACAALIGMADVEREWNQLARAKSHALKGLELARQARFSAVEVYAQVVLAQISQAQSDTSQADEHLRSAEAILSLQDVRRRERLDAERVRLYLWQGKLAKALRWAQTEQTTNRQGQEERERITLARALLAQGKIDEGLSLIRALLKPAQRAGRTVSIIELKVFEALALESKGHTNEALEVFGVALKLAEPEGFIRLFIDEGQPVLTLLQRDLAEGVAPAYVSKLLTSFETPEKDATSGLLTKRELEILKLIAEGLSNDAIAEKLIRSLGTVKTHTSNIYSKLGVKNRTEAVARARELELL